MIPRAATALSIFASLSCAGAGPAPIATDGFLAAFEYAQMHGGKAAGYQMILCEFEDKQITLYASATEPMDRYLAIWGPEHPAVPIFLSGQAAARLSGIEAAGLSWGMSSEEAQEWAWQKLDYEGPAQ